MLVVACLLAYFVCLISSDAQSCSSCKLLFAVMPVLLFVSGHLRRIGLHNNVSQQQAFKSREMTKTERKEEK
jgi:hypothetical protein